MDTLTPVSEWQLNKACLILTQVEEDAHVVFTINLVLQVSDEWWFEPGHGDWCTCLEKYTLCRDGMYHKVFYAFTSFQRKTFFCSNRNKHIIPTIGQTNLSNKSNSHFERHP